MSAEILVKAEIRTDLGKGASRRLRRLQSLIPGIVYGAESDPVSLSVPLKDITKHLENEAFYSQILTLSIADQNEQVILKDLQRDPAKDTPVHIDFLRIAKGTEIKMAVQLHFINEEKCIGVALEGGRISHQKTEVEVQCLPKDLPKYIEVDMAQLKAGSSIHLSDLTLSAGVTLTNLQNTDHDLVVATVVAAKGKSDDNEASDSTDSSESE